MNYNDINRIFGKLYLACKNEWINNRTFIIKVGYTMYYINTVNELIDFINSISNNKLLEIEQDLDKYNDVEMER